MNYFAIFQQFLFFNIHMVYGSGSDETETSKNEPTCSNYLYLLGFIVKKKKEEVNSQKLRIEQKLIYNDYNYFDLFIDIGISDDGKKQLAKKEIADSIISSKKNSIFRFGYILKDIISKIEAARDPNLDISLRQNMPKEINFVSIIIEVMKLIQILQENQTLNTECLKEEKLGKIIEELQAEFFDLVILINEKGFKGQISDLKDSFQKLKHFGLCREPKVNISQGFVKVEDINVKKSVKQKEFDLDLDKIELIFHVTIKISESIEPYMQKYSRHYQNSNKIYTFFGHFFQSLKEILCVINEIITDEIKISCLVKIFNLFELKNNMENQHAELFEFICFQLEKQSYIDLCSIKDYLNKGILSASNNKHTMRSNIINVIKKIHLLLDNEKEIIPDASEIQKITSELCTNQVINSYKSFRINENYFRKIKSIFNRNKLNKIYSHMCIEKYNLITLFIQCLCDKMNQNFMTKYTIEEFTEAIYAETMEEKNICIYDFLELISYTCSIEIIGVLDGMLDKHQLHFMNNYPQLSKLLNEFTIKSVEKL